MELKVNKVVIFKNRKTGEKQPEWKGKIDINGERFEIALWESISAKGEKYLSGSIQPPRKEESPTEYKKYDVDKLSGKTDIPENELDNDGLPF